MCTSACPKPHPFVSGLWKEMLGCLPKSPQWNTLRYIQVMQVTACSTIVPTTNYKNFWLSLNLSCASCGLFMRDTREKFGLENDSTVNFSSLDYTLCIPFHFTMGRNGQMRVVPKCHKCYSLSDLSISHCCTIKKERQITNFNHILLCGNTT